MLCYLLGIVCCLSLCRAQATTAFTWQFSRPNTTSGVPACDTVDVNVGPLPEGGGAVGVPPYYMIAMEVGGIPTTSLLGSDTNSSLRWTVVHAPESKLMLSVVDSEGNSGGTSSQFYTVIEGPSTSCYNATNQTSEFHVTSNATSTLATCDPWGIVVGGGSPPYSITLAALDSPTVTNITLGDSEDVYTYINRANPGSDLIAAVSDSQGRWATGTPLVKTGGSTDVSCSGLQSGGSKYNNSDTENADASSSDASHEPNSASRTTAIAVGVSVPVTAFLVAGLIFVVCKNRRRPANLRWRVEQYNITHDRTQQTDGQSSSPGSFGSFTSEILHKPSSIHKGPVHRIDAAPRFPPGLSRSLRPLPHPPNEGHGLPLAPRLPNVGGQTVSSTSENHSSRQSQQTPQPLKHSLPSNAPSRSELAPTTFLSNSRGDVPDQLASSSSNSHVISSDELVFQHRDGGSPSPVMREIPPPYVDHILRRQGRQG